MKIGIEISIDVTKIDKDRIFVGKKGKYITLTSFVDIENKDKYDTNGFVTQKKEKGESGQMPILGNVKVFWKDEQPNDPKQEDKPGDDISEGDIPF